MTAGFTLGWYNGWSPQERLASIPIQREAVRTGVLPRPTRCSICGFNKIDDPTSDNRVGLHDEDYGDPLAAYEMCLLCHRILHERFESAAPWRALVERHGNGSRWFEHLHMDAATQRRPFCQSYPAGLPKN